PAAPPATAQAARVRYATSVGDGSVAVGCCDLAAARTAYTESLPICRRLVEADPGNAQAARDLSVSLWRLAELTDKAAGAGSEAATLAWREVALEFQRQRRHGWIMPADETAEAYAQSRARIRPA
ncbi:MAG: hypothetical protein QM286_04465, partial [Acidobacteriota bacterium]|nr:hypothetical protein [Acidobacteriota bacterium]